MKNPAQDLQAKLVRKAREDVAFRRELIASPKAALRSLGIPLPEGVELKVVEETSSRWYLVLPAAGGSETPDEQLEAVAGGLAYPTGLSLYGASVASGGVPGMANPIGAGGVPGAPVPIPIGGGGVPGKVRPIGPVRGGGVPG